ncbi:MAG: hypothetical protein KJ645_10700 [Planctomycetes bacterium]|nr:hypothetical protein [Planctomycetota bacterium]
MSKFLIIMALAVFSPLFPGASFSPDPEGPDGGSLESPHFNESRCGDCHGRDLPEIAEAWGSLDNYYNALCKGCHEEPSLPCRFHEGNMPGEASAWDEANDFPLIQGAMSCLTCHDAGLQCVITQNRNSGSNPFFLRGDPSGPTARFCFACHRAEEFSLFKVHENDQNGEQCLFCHLKIPGTGRGENQFALRAGSRKTCLVCHEYRAHPQGIDHLRPWEPMPERALGRLIPRVNNKEALQMQQGSTLWILPLDTGRTISCTTCHDPHRKAEKTPFLLRMPSRAWLCRCCHTPPEKGVEQQ